MNKRFEELADQAGAEDFYGGNECMDLEKFAELIVRECSVYCEGHILPKGMAEENGLNYNDGVTDCVIGVKQYFGVDE